MYGVDMRKVLLSAILAAVAVLTGCANRGKDIFSTTSATTATVAATTEETTGTAQTAAPTINAASDGQFYFTFKVTIDGETDEFSITTDEDSVGAALYEQAYIDGIDDDGFGLIVDTVNGLYLDPNYDKACWNFYINGVVAEFGCYETEIENGQIYEFRKEAL
jgi:outer membrane murein-binding lipoprotein Lpp